MENNYYGYDPIIKNWNILKSKKRIKKFNKPKFNNSKNKKIKS
jgi:hypothetical protein